MIKILRLILTNNILMFLLAIPAVVIMTPVPKPPAKGINKRLQPYVTSFEQWGRYATRKKNYKIPEINMDIGVINEFSIAIIAPGAIGICYWVKNPKEIIISEKWWNTASHFEREMVVFHELGHCALNRLHYDAIDPWGKKISLMYPVIFSSNTYRKNRLYYIDELFNPW